MSSNKQVLRRVRCLCRLAEAVKVCCLRRLAEAVQVRPGRATSMYRQWRNFENYFSSKHTR
jgi:hypothetical protein